MVSSDAELVRMAQGGDVASLGILLERHRAPLYALALGTLGHGPETQDAVQDTFLIALRRIDQVREAEAIGGWLRAVLRSVCYTRLRQRRSELFFGEKAARLGPGPSEASAEESIDRLALRDWVWTALAQLPEVLRVTVMLRYFGSYPSYEEIAAILGVPVGTIRSRLNQVKVKLADALLKTAELEHGETRLLGEFQTRFFTEAFDRYNRKRDYGVLANSFSEDLTWAYPDGTLRRGRASSVHVFEADLGAGMRMVPTNVISSRSVTVVELDFLNPSDDPSHCPPATSMVFFNRDGEIHELRQYYAPRAEQGDMPGPTP